MGPTLPPDRGHSADLRRTQGEAARMEGAAERQRHYSGAIPAHLEHSGLETGNRERRCKPLGCSTRMDDEISFGARLLRGCETTTQSCRDAFARRIDVDQLDFGAG